MILKGKVLQLDDDDEEMVVLEVDNHVLTCFAAVCPYPIKVGESYPVELHPFFFEEPEGVEVSESLPDEIQHIGNGFSCLLTGRLVDGKFSIGSLILVDENDFSNLRHLEGRKLKLTVDRMDAEFFETTSDVSH